MSFIQLTSPLVLHADPVLPAHAVTRQYVDNKRLNIDAGAFTTGMITVGRFPAFTGDVSSVAGSGAVTLNVNGVTAGAYAKVTVDSTGRVLSGGALSGNDIANVSWNKIVSGKPTTAAGYGITGLISLSGGTVTGSVVSTAVPSAGLHAVTKGYVDNAITGVVSASLSSGDVVRKTVAIAPAGFLRCNGGGVSKTTYAGLFAVVGEKYSHYTFPGVTVGSGKPWVQQYEFNDSLNLNITEWFTGPSLPVPLINSQVVVTKSQVYLLGGVTNGNNYLSTVHTAPINLDGTIGAWTTSTSLPFTIGLSQAIVTKNRIYLIGGTINGNNSSAVYTAPINLDGTIGTWVSSGSTISGNISGAQAIVTKNRVHLLGYSCNTAPINIDGTLGTWTAGVVVPDFLPNSQVVVTKNRVYLLGGAGSGGPSSTVYTTTINPDGTLGTWTTASSLPGGASTSQAVVTKNRVYLFGGDNSSAVYTAPINLDGTIGTWATSTSLPITFSSSQAILTKNRVYLLGGYQNSFSSLVFSAIINGGLNDYSEIYSGLFTSTDSNDFSLPDFTPQEVDEGVNYFIKT